MLINGTMSYEQIEAIILRGSLRGFERELGVINAYGCVNPLGKDLFMLITENPDNHNTFAVRVYNPGGAQNDKYLQLLADIAKKYDGITRRDGWERASNVSEQWPVKQFA